MSHQTQSMLHPLAPSRGLLGASVGVRAHPPRLNPSYRQQRGVVLMSALIIMLTLTLIALALIRLSVVELKVAGASQRYQILFNDAESMAALYFYSNQKTFVDGCLETSTGSTGLLNSGDRTLANQDVCHFLDGASSSGALVFDESSKTLRIPNILTDFARVELRIEQMQCIDNYFSQVDSGQGNDTTAPSAVFFNIRSQAWDQLDSDSSVTIHTGLIAQIPPGMACRNQGAVNS